MPALLMNICIVGLNQVYDVRIDRVNKPYLPLASGEFSMQTGIALVCCRLPRMGYPSGQHAACPCSLETSLSLPFSCPLLMRPNREVP